MASDMPSGIENLHKQQDEAVALHKKPSLELTSGNNDFFSTSYVPAMNDTLRISGAKAFALWYTNCRLQGSAGGHRSSKTLGAGVRMHCPHCSCMCAEHSAHRA